MLGKEAIAEALSTGKTVQRAGMPLLFSIDN